MTMESAKNSERLDRANLFSIYLLTSEMSDSYSIFRLFSCLVCFTVPQCDSLNVKRNKQVTEGKEKEAGSRYS